MVKLIRFSDLRYEMVVSRPVYRFDSENAINLD